MRFYFLQFFSGILLLTACSQPILSSQKNINLSSYEGVKKQPFEETIFGKKISDPYRWMEKDQEVVREWMLASADHSNQQFKAISGYQDMYKALLALSKESAKTHSVVQHGDKLFYLSQGVQDSAANLYIKTSEKVRLLLDSASFKPNESTPIAINNFSLSPSGKTIAFHISSNGSDIGEMHFIDVATGKLLDHKLPPVWGEFKVHWLDETHIFVTTMSYKVADDPVQGMQAISYNLETKVTKIELGPDAVDAPEYKLREFPIIRPVSDSDWIIAFATGARPDMRVLVKAKAGANWLELADYTDNIISAAMQGDSLYMLSQHKASNGQLLKLNLNQSQSLNDATIVVGESDNILRQVINSGEDIYLLSSKNGIDALSTVEGNKIRQVSLPAKGVISAVMPDKNSNSIVFMLETPIQPETLFRIKNHKVTNLGFTPQAAELPRGFQIVREEAVSADGTKVPMSIYGRKQDLNIASPTLIFAYGGYGVSIQPWYRPTMFPFLAQGGIWVDCHVRGGGEKGRIWHEGGRGANKPNGHADLIACAEHLIKTGRSTPEQMGAWGGSMGGNLVGPTILKRPDLFGHAVLSVAKLNPLRLLHTKNGQNQIGEIGDPRTEQGFKDIWEMDSYHWLNRVSSYPDIMLDVGLHDERVEVWHSAKFAARYLENDKGKLMLINADEKAGHGHSSSKTSKAKKYSSIYTYMLNRSGHPDFQLP